jgi:ribonuclease VapC
VIIDTSAIVAIVRQESTAQACLEALEAASQISISAGSLMEASIVIDRMDDQTAILTFDHLLLRYDITIEPVTEAHVRFARLAYRRYGRGNDSKAKLNFGDCFAYALARERNESLLFTGDDFTHTDLRSALDP